MVRGIDLVFPHHENENAQAIALTGKPLARYWMHNGFLNIDGEKMSKSLKNFFTARDILQEYDADAIRHFFLSKHYRSPIDFTRELIEESHKAMQNFYKAIDAFDPKLLEDIAGKEATMDQAELDFQDAMNDDFNTAKAIAILFDLAHKSKKAPDQIERGRAAATLLRLGKTLGFFQNMQSRSAREMPDLSKSLIELILGYRSDARQNKNWVLSDKIRDDLLAIGIEIKDSPAGTNWNLRK
jgi:cysteinyl-tRNA synthetase